MDTTTQSELDRVLQGPDHVIVSDELSDSLNILALDTELLEIDGRAFVASLIKAKCHDAHHLFWEIQVSTE